jgi:hypothetical protein
MPEGKKTPQETDSTVNDKKMPEGKNAQNDESQK